MATIRVHCPTCNAELELDARHAGEEVECGSCLQVFVAREPARPDPDPDEPRRGTRRRWRRRDDDDDYDYRPPRAGGGTGLAVTALVLGILSIPLACCCTLLAFPMSLGAVVTGAIGMKNPEGRGMAVTGLVLGIVGLVLAVVSIVVGIGLNLNNAPQFNRGR
jgi:hypothetical protein